MTQRPAHPSLQQSEVSVVSEVFWGEVLSTGQIRPGSKPEAKRLHRGKEVETNTNTNVYNRKTPSLSAQFKNSLTVLIDRMTECHPHFIRCIKPNQAQEANNFVGDFVRTQLLYTGLWPCGTIVAHVCRCPRSHQNSQGRFLMAPLFLGVCDSLQDARLSGHKAEPSEVQLKHCGSCRQGQHWRPCVV